MTVAGESGVAAAALPPQSMTLPGLVAAVLDTRAL